MGAPASLVTSIASRFKRSLERATGFEPATASLEGWNSTTELRPPSFSNSPSALLTPLTQKATDANKRPVYIFIHVSYGGQARIRTLEADGSRFTVCPLCPLGYLPVQQLNRSADPSYVNKIKGKCKAGIQDKAQFLLLQQVKKGISNFSFVKPLRAAPTKRNIIYTHQKPVKRLNPKHGHR